MLCKWLYGLTLACLLLIGFVTASHASQLDTTTAIAAASTLSKQVSAQEWLGPLAGIALSPFFGLACLSGAATYGPEWLQNRSALFSPASPLNNPLLFWIMTGLTVMTSLPRMTKVSKPLALAAEKLELYSTLIVLLALRFFGPTAINGQPTLTIDSDVLLIAGMPWDVFLSLAAALNLVVINTVKIAIEILVWLIPVPTVDALLEVANKSTCAGLISLYAYSPALATLLNVILFSICCLFFFQIKRRLAYLREIYLLPMLESLFRFSRPDSLPLYGFLAAPWNSLPSRTAIRLFLSENSDHVELQIPRWLVKEKKNGLLVAKEFQSGMVADTIVIMVDQQRIELHVRRGFAEKINATIRATILAGV
jgi:hypothetical protein